MRSPGVAEAGGVERATVEARERVERATVEARERVEAADLLAKVRRAAAVSPLAPVQAGALPRRAGVRINRIGRVP
jgi:hypothetical protein